MKKKLFFFTTILIYFLVPFLIMFNKSLYDYKFYILTIIGLLMLLTIKLLKIPLKKFGITKNNFKKSIMHNIPIIIIGIIAIIVLNIMGISRYNSDETIWFYLFYIFISCPIQEFLYRGVLGYFDNNKYVWVIQSSFCYSFVHIIYRDSMTLFITFIMGIIWYLLYRKDKNLIGVCLSHIVLGILTIFLGIIN